MKKLYFKEYEELVDGYHLVVMFVTSHRCGYVGLPYGHELENVEYDNLDFDVHGGLTFSASLPSFNDGAHKWYLGFDCMHLDDGPDIKVMKKNGVDKNTIDIYKGFDGTVKDKDYVMKELYKLVCQLKGKI